MIKFCFTYFPYPWRCTSFTMSSCYCQLNNTFTNVWDCNHLMRKHIPAISTVQYTMNGKRPGMYRSDPEHGTYGISGLEPPLRYERSLCAREKTSRQTPPPWELGGVIISVMYWYRTLRHDKLRWPLVSDYHRLWSTYQFCLVSGLKRFCCFPKHSHSQSQRCVYRKPLGILHYRSA